MTSRDRRAVVIGGSAIAASWLLLRALPAGVQAVGRLREHAIETQATALRAREVLAAAPSMRDSLAMTLSAIVGLAPLLVEGRSSAEAQASLAGLVNASAGRHSLKVSSLDPLPDSGLGVLSRVEVHAILEGDVRGLQGFLRSVETEAPVLTVTTVSIAAADPGSRAALSEALRVELDVAGLFLPRGSQ
jgi:type II secretion system (T2SS) protein M